MSGVPMSIIYEEDVQAGWLLQDGKPRVPMLFLCGQSEPLPDKATKAIQNFVAAGGRLFLDEHIQTINNKHEIAVDVDVDRFFDRYFSVFDR